MEMKKNEYRSAPDSMGAASDPGAIRRYNLKNDAVTVVHSGESDPMPNQDAQEAYSDTVDTEGNMSPPVSEVEENDENDFEAQQSLAEEGEEETIPKEDVA